jgi:hypothetical protein
MDSDQVMLPRSLDFPGRSIVLVPEIAKRLQVSERHIFHEIDAGELTAIDLKGAGAKRRCARVPIECYREYAIRHLTGPLAKRTRLLHTLPAATRRTLIRELQSTLSNA